jgi:hypothetical protein
VSAAGYDEAIGRAAKLTSIPATHIRIGAGHTHAGPSFQRAKGPLGVGAVRYERMLRTYREMVSDKIVGAVVAANAQLRPVHAWAARGVGTININRRFRAQGGRPAAVGLNPEGFVDRDLIVMRIDDAAGKPYALVVNFQCHGTVLGYENKVASSDWIGALRQTVEQAFPGALCVYLQGAAGNQGPIEGYSGDLAVAHRLGATLGHQAAAVALGIETVVREPRFEGFVESTAYQARQPWRVRGPRDSTLRFMHRTLELPRRQYSAAEIDEMARLHDDAQQKAAAAKSSGDAWRVHQAEARARRIGDLLAKWKRPADPTPVKLGVNVLRVGELALVATAGEPFAEIGAAVKKASPFAVTMFAGYSSLEGGGYMPVESEYAHGGYEVQMTPYAAGAAEKLVRDIAAIYSQIR